MLRLAYIHPITIICLEYKKSKRFYTEVVGLEAIKKVYRKVQLNTKTSTIMQLLYTLF